MPHYGVNGRLLACSLVLTMPVEGHTLCFSWWVHLHFCVLFMPIRIKIFPKHRIKNWSNSKYQHQNIISVLCRLQLLLRHRNYLAPLPLLCLSAIHPSTWPVHLGTCPGTWLGDWRCGTLGTGMLTETTHATHQNAYWYFSNHTCMRFRSSNFNRISLTDQCLWKKNSSLTRLIKSVIVPSGFL